MAEETINEVITRAKARALHSQHYGLPSDKEDALALIAELETLRAQRDEYKEALESIRDAVSAIDTYDIDDDAMLVFIATVDEDTRAALNTQPQAEWTPRFVVGETVRVDRFIDDAFAGWLGEIEQIKRVGDTYEYYLVADNHPGFARYPFGWFAEKLIDGDDNVPDWVEGMDKEAD